MALAIIPSRYGAQRFAGKPLTLIAGLPMVVQVYLRCVEAKCFEKVIVATDDERIAQVSKAAGATVVFTSAACASGTDRVAEAAASLQLAPEAVVINVQGDEPALRPQSLQQLVALFEAPHVEMGTLVRPLDEHERSNPNVVKVVRAEKGEAIYFSRADIPHQRNGQQSGLQRWAHVGLYGYRSHLLARLAKLPPTALERTESLEQLRALGHGITIHCAQTTHRSVAVDTPDDVAAAEAAVKAL